jgi:ubiquinone/menaquinone biosynthesis C-methylase UbiE
MTTDRVAAEAIAHDDGTVYREAVRLQRRFIHVIECPNNRSAENHLTAAAAKAIPGGVVLDLGCYEGVAAGRYTKLNPKKIVGIDISAAAIERARQSFGHVAEFHVMDAHRLDFQDASFDVVIGRSILHHLDYEAAISEIARVLKPGGYAIFTEPLRDNPAAKVFRLLTPKARTKDELPLSRKQITWADRQFRESDHFFSGMASAAVGLVTSLTPLKPDNVFLRVADNLDRFIATTPARYWMRRVMLVWKK